MELDESVTLEVHRCSRDGDLATLQNILSSRGNDVNQRDKFDSTPLHHACQNGRMDTVSCLLEHGANINATNASNITPLHRASHQGTASVVELLLSKGAITTACDIVGLTSLHLAAKCGHDGVVAVLLTRGANPNAGDDQLRTPLYYACHGGHLAVVETLVRRGASINIRDKSSLTALHVACRRTHHEVAVFLARSGGNIYARTEQYITPLDFCNNNTFRDQLREAYAPHAGIFGRIFRRKSSTGSRRDRDAQGREGATGPVISPAAAGPMLESLSLSPVPQSELQVVVGRLPASATDGAQQRIQGGAGAAGSREMDEEEVKEELELAMPSSVSPASEASSHSHFSLSDHEDGDDEDDIIDPYFEHKPSSSSAGTLPLDQELGAIAGPGAEVGPGTRVGEREADGGGEGNDRVMKERGMGDRPTQAHSTLSGPHPPHPHLSSPPLSSSPPAAPLTKLRSTTEVPSDSTAWGLQWLLPRRHSRGSYTDEAKSPYRYPPDAGGAWIDKSKLPTPEKLELRITSAPARDRFFSDDDVVMVDGDPGGEIRGAGERPRRDDALGDAASKKFQKTFHDNHIGLVFHLNDEGFVVVDKVREPKDDDIPDKRLSDPWGGSGKRCDEEGSGGADCPRAGDLLWCVGPLEPRWPVHEGLFVHLMEYVKASARPLTLQFLRPAPTPAPAHASAHAPAHAFIDRKGNTDASTSSSSSLSPSMDSAKQRPPRAENAASSTSAAASIQPAINQRSNRKGHAGVEPIVVQGKVVNSTNERASVMEARGKMPEVVSENRAAGAGGGSRARVWCDELKSGRGEGSAEMCGKRGGDVDKLYFAPTALHEGSQAQSPSSRARRPRSGTLPLVLEGDEIDPQGDSVDKQWAYDGLIANVSTGSMGAEVNGHTGEDAGRVKTGEGEGDGEEIPRWHRCGVKGCGAEGSEAEVVELRNACGHVVCLRCLASHLREVVRTSTASTPGYGFGPSIFALPLPEDYDYSSRSLMGKFCSELHLVPEAVCPISGCGTGLSLVDVFHLPVMQQWVESYYQHEDFISRFQQCGLDDLYMCCREEQLACRAPFDDLLQLHCGHFFHPDCIGGYVQDCLTHSGSPSSSSSTSTSGKGGAKSASSPPPLLTCPTCVRTVHRCSCQFCMTEFGPRAGLSHVGEHIIVDNDIDAIVQRGAMSPLAKAQFLDVEQAVTSRAVAQDQGVESFVCSRCNFHMEYARPPRSPRTARGADTIVCGNRSCRYLYCAQCHCDAHVGKTCDEAKIVTLDKDTMATNFLQACPQCARVWAIPSECNHVTCSTSSGGCGAEFCFLCAALHKPALAHYNIYHRPGCRRFEEGACCEKKCVTRAATKGQLAVCVETKYDPKNCPECAMLGKLCPRPHPPGEGDPFLILDFDAVMAEKERLSVETMMMGFK